MSREVNSEQIELNGDEIAENGAELDNKDDDVVITEEEAKTSDGKEKTSNEEVKEPATKSKETPKEPVAQPAEPSPEGEPLQNGLKNVEGETPKERALRAELTRLRQANRGKIQIPEPEAEKPKVDERMTKLREKYSEEEISNMEDAVDVIASAKGYVKKGESFQQTANDVLKDFISEHKEYSPENDTDDIHWNRFNTILMQDYNIKGKSAKQIEQIYTKVHRDVQGEFGETPAPAPSPNATAAKAQKLKSASHAGGVSAQPSSVKPVVDSEARGHFKGFSDDDF